ncbi:MAG: hypothetical protein HYY06_32635, partial [Deltaproteobacteria bacterium]|nr:hypothetical protein [Deltaproteobacteria bacterium]
MPSALRANLSGEGGDWGSDGGHGEGHGGGHGGGPDLGDRSAWTKRGRGCWRRPGGVRGLGVGIGVETQMDEDPMDHFSLEDRRDV